MSNTVIKAENISKLYRLGEVGTGSFAQDLNRWWAKLRSKEDPYMKIATTNDRTVKSDSDYVWALKDISFEVKQGEVLGIIGKNGAGKSTLLKILSRTTTPTTGSIKARGRIASLLEVGTGFHPELSGRDNIFLNGAILGMSRHEITRKYDEIVAFAGVEKYIYTPVKRYSSGMYVRLAFAVAAHLESEILIIDEVLAVGDFEFQKKCLGKMGDVAAKEGRTVLFVSHNMEAVRKLCTSGLLLKTGMKLNASNDIQDVIEKYFTEFGTKNIKSSFFKGESISSNLDAILLEAEILNSQKEQSSVILFGEEFYIRMKWRKLKKINATAFACRIVDEFETYITATNTLDTNLAVDEAGDYEFIIKVPNYLAPKNYTITCGCFIRPHSTINIYENILHFQILEIPYSKEFTFNLVGKPVVSFPFEWKQL